MKKIFIVILVLGVLLVLYFAYTKYTQLQEAKLVAKQMEEQRMLVEAQTAQSEACSKNWMCATKDILGGLGGIIDIF